MEEGLSI